ncbi:MAG: thermonuclease family protein, partial [Bdellovibrionales bacterium]|nr:thermonuclease family protein [Bdellovibrionales bacterium]
CVEYVGNYDGDTLTFDVADVHPLLGKNMKVRVHGIDTAEIRSDDACEREVAGKTQQMVQELISGANRVDLVNVAREKYFRVLADVMVDNRSLAEYLLRKGLAIRYDGGTKPDVNWCRVR